MTIYETDLSKIAAHKTASEIATRCDIHGEKMDGEGWYTTANVLWLAAEKLRQMEAVIRALRA